MSLEWLIVGGGIHGVHVAARLIGEGGVEPDRVRLIDPATTLLARWRACTSTTGMTHLRSPSVHHLDLDPWSLQRFAGKRKTRKPGLFAPPYDRPALDLFDAHCDKVIERFGLAELHIQDRVIGAEVDCDHVTIQTASGETYTAQRVVLALGASDQPLWPDWAPPDDPRVHHIFATDFDGWPADSPERVAVIGGGISAGQVALRLLDAGHEVHLIARHALRQHQFDSDPGWLGPKSMRRFDKETNPDRRREMIGEARHRGSVPPEVRRALRQAFESGRVTWHEAEVQAAETSPDGLNLTLSSDDALEVDRVLLATGFRAERPGGALIDGLIASAALPCAQCGYPIVDTALRWHPRVHVTGPLAELELGPVSRNIAGARRAGDRLLAVVRSEQASREAS